MNHSHWGVRRIGVRQGAGRLEWNAAQRAWRAMALPFRVVAGAWRLAVAIGVGIVRLMAELCAAALGVAILLFVGYGLARALLHPLFEGL